MPRYKITLVYIQGYHNLYDGLNMIFWVVVGTAVKEFARRHLSGLDKPWFFEENPVWWRGWGIKIPRTKGEQPRLGEGSQAIALMALVY